MPRKISGLGLALLLAGVLACSEDPSKKEKSDFFRKMEQESEAFARRKVKERKEQEARQKQQTEEYYKRLEEAARSSQAAAAPAAGPAASAGEDVQYVLSDKDLTFLVLNKIRLMQHRSTVSVECKDGVVKLFGETDSAETRQRLVTELRKLPGVRKVDASELYPAAE